MSRSNESRNRKTILVLNGKSKAGKDTFYKANKDKAIRFAFADELKEFCKRHFGVPVEKYEDPEQARKQRDVWIAVGHAGRVATDGRVWVDKVVSKIRMAALGEKLGGNEVPTIVITDCGFDNELQVLKEEFPTWDVKLVQIRRPGFEEENDGRNLLDFKHINGALIMNNSSTEEAFMQDARGMFDDIIVDEI
jgi:hypothetical protein